MPDFNYSVLSQGVRRSGVLAADSAAQAAVQLRAEGALILQLQLSAGGSDPWAALKTRFKSGTGCLLIRRTQIELTFRQLGALLRAGVPVLSALSALAETSARPLREALLRVGDAVRNGQSFSKALRAHLPQVDRATLGLMEIGEANGSLDRMADHAAGLMERSRKIRADILQALGYPVLLLLVGLGLGYYMVHSIFPVLMGFIQQGRAVELPLATRMLIELNDFLMAYGLYLIAAPFVLAGLIMGLRQGPRTGPLTDALGLHVPLLGGAVRFYSNAMWCMVLGSMLSSGLDMLSAVELVEQTMGNGHYRVQFRRMLALLRAGNSFSGCLAKTELKKLCPMGYALSRVNEAGGVLDEGLLQVAAFSEEQMARRVALLCKLVEPSVFVFVGGLVGLIYFGFFMAVYAAAGSAI